MAQESSRESSPTADVRMSPGMASYGPDGGSFARLPAYRSRIQHSGNACWVLGTTPLSIVIIKAGGSVD